MSTLQFSKIYFIPSKYKLPFRNLLSKQKMKKLNKYCKFERNKLIIKPFKSVLQISQFSKLFVVSSNILITLQEAS